MLAKFGRSISEMKRISPLLRLLLLPLILWLTLKGMRVPTAPSRLWALIRGVTLPLLNIAVPIYIYLARPLCWLCVMYAGALRGRHRRRPEAVGERVQPRHHQVARLHHHFPLQNLRRKIECVRSVFFGRVVGRKREEEEEEALRCAAPLNQRAAT